MCSPAGYRQESTGITGLLADGLLIYRLSVKTMWDARAADHPDSKTCMCLGSKAQNRYPAASGDGIQGPFIGRPAGLLLSVSPSCVGRLKNGLSALKGLLYNRVLSSHRPA